MEYIKKPRTGNVTPASILFLLFLFTCLGSGSVYAVVKTFVPYDKFFSEMKRAQYKDYAEREGTKVKSAAEFEKMKAHVLSMYEGVKVKNSFVLGENDYVDCVDIYTQPGLRQGGKRQELAKPPAAKIAEEKEEDHERTGQAVEPMLGRQKRDAFGNVQFCEEGFIPMRRVTLDELVRYETLADFFNKYGKAGEKGDPQRK
jgi:hypothetical protein